MDSLAHCLEIIAQRFIKELSDTLIVLKDLTAREFAPGYTLHSVKSSYSICIGTVSPYS